ncbi:MAG: hypothetical protein JW794_07465 [Candidatus Cloacimonetes bacterium]|nr:hypothetical protein [Candidatus Cloacimonadota bacterium]
MKRVIFMFAVILFLSSQLVIAENNQVPQYQFLTYPTTIMTSYYDYLPGGLNTYPIAPQTECGDGTYLTFMAKETFDSNRLQYGALLNANGTVNSLGPFSPPNHYQGYGDINIHPASGRPIVTWHELDLETVCVITYHNPDAIEPWPKGIFYSTPPDEYIWPQIHRGPSPFGDDWIRYYHISYNATHDNFDHPCEDIRILYLDIENVQPVDLDLLINQANWTEVCPLYSWRDVSCRPSASFAIDYVNPGHVAIIGLAFWLEGDLGNMPVQEGAFVWESFDYGATWDTANLHDDGPGSAFYDVDNLPQFELPNGDIPDKLYTRAGGYKSTAIIDNEGNVHFPYLQEYTMEDADGYYYFQIEFLPQAEFVWDGDEFIFRNVPAFPWMDTGGSGHDVPWGIDPVTSDTLLQYVQGHYFYDTPYPWGSVQAQSFSLDNEWMMQLWTDCTYHYFALNGIPGYDEYLNHPLIAISASNDNGETWSEPLYLTDIYNPNYNFADQITVYPYTQKVIRDVDDSDGKFVIMYMDDNDFGSYIQGQGPCTGGQINECIVQMDFSFLGTNPESEQHQIICENYPNPFGISTRISFSSKRIIPEDAEVVIYNTKGQFVRLLSLTREIPQSGYADWDGKNAAGSDVANGIYFYKLTGSMISPIGKMLIVR